MKRAFFIIAFISCNLLYGQTIQDFSLVNVIDESKVSLSSFSDARGVVVIFTSNNCPYAKLYEKRIQALHKDYSGKGLELLLINPNNPKSSPGDDQTKMRARATANNYSFPYLADKDQSVSKVFGARKTPEVFLLKPTPSGYNVVYKGSFDDNPQNDADVNDPYLIRAVEGLLNNQPITTNSSRPVGCVIKS